MNSVFSTARYRSARFALSIRKADLNPNQSPKYRSETKPEEPMKSKTMIVCVAIISLRLLGAQTNEPANDWKPAPTNQGGKEYPKFNSEGRVKFRIAATNAQSVGVSFRDSSAFTKGEDGAWYGYTR